MFFLKHCLFYVNVWCITAYDECTLHIALNRFTSQRHDTLREWCVAGTITVLATVTLLLAYMYKVYLTFGSFCG